MTLIQLVDLHKTFQVQQEPVQVLDGLSFTVEAGEFVCIIGPSGCGKSTLFNLLAGLEQPDRGRVWIDGADVTGQRGLVSYMPQRDALLPWRSVVENAVLPAIVRGDDVATARHEARQLLGVFGLEGFGDTRPDALSGGMKQRAALLRTVLWNRPIMLLDEPFGALDALTRTQMQQWLLGLWDRLERTIVFITHDVEEALLLADRVVVMTSRPGRIALHLQVPLPRPREISVVATPEFARLKAQLLRSLGAMAA
jgi:ABC-type nitrate/sulfonate/bicarbonate transport system ATPase subunit